MEDYRINTTEKELSKIMNELKYKDPTDTIHKFITYLRHLEKHKEDEEAGGCTALFQLHQQGYVSTYLLTQLMPVIKDIDKKYEVTFS